MIYYVHNTQGCGTPIEIDATEAARAEDAGWQLRTTAPEWIDQSSDQAHTRALVTRAIADFDARQSRRAADARAASERAEQAEAERNLPPRVSAGMSAAALINCMITAELDPDFDSLERRVIREQRMRLQVALTWWPTAKKSLNMHGAEAVTAEHQMMEHERRAYIGEVKADVAYTVAQYGVRGSK